MFINKYYTIFVFQKLIMRRTILSLTIFNVKWIVVVMAGLFILNCVILFESATIQAEVVSINKETKMSEEPLKITQSTALLTMTLPWQKRILFANQSMGADTLSIILFLFIAAEMFFLSSAIEKRRYFESANYKRLARIAIAIAIYFVLEAVVRNLADEIVRSQTNNGFRYSFRVIPNLIIGFLIYLFILLAAYFREGYQMQKEQQFTI